MTLGLCVAQAMFMQPELEPLDRLVASAEKYAKSHDSDPSAHYTLARVHYLAFALRINSVPAFPPDGDGRRQPVPDHLVGLPVEMARRARAVELAREELKLGDQFPQDEAKRQAYWQAVTRLTEKLKTDGWQPPALPATALAGHAEAALIEFRRAIELDSKDGLFRLGLGSLLVQVADWIETEKSATVPEALKGDLRSDARAAFLKSWQLAHPVEVTAKSLPPSGLAGFVSHEAGRAFINLCDAAGDKLPVDQKAAIPKVKAGIAKLEKIPQQVITPMTFSLNPKPHLADMLDANASVEFDLRGIGAAERWSWIKPELGLIVWDPLDRREITSGRQLFGHYTFRIFRQNGYEALAALDDNGDGRLSDWELTGLSAWFDRNGDGRSDGNEVIPLQQLGVRALACTFTGTDGVHPTNPKGVRLDDGRELPSWDWMPTPAATTP